MTKEEKISFAEEWFNAMDWKAQDFQKQTWKAVLEDKHGIVNAPTGSGKTYSLIIPILLRALGEEYSEGLKAIWLTPLRALSRDIAEATQEAIDGLGLEWKVALRTGDISSYQKQKLYKNPPDILITTPESLHILIARREYKAYFANLKTIVIDEWHELIGSKRGVLVELALSHLKHLLPEALIWGISATIGNMEQAAHVLLGNYYEEKQWEFIKHNQRKEILMHTIMPEKIERFPWAGHLGLSMLEKVLPVIEDSESTLVFTNTRSQCELWYQRILQLRPDWAGTIAMHHGSISQDQRNWVEDAIHSGKLMAVVCTSSLDLGVDFRPVDTIVQIGSPKGIARFVQRAGRSGHKPGEVSTIYFVPTHSLELLEAASLKEAIKEDLVEHRVPYIRSFDVLIQFIMTLAISDGVDPDSLYNQILTSFSYESVSREEWDWLVSFLVHGGRSLTAYDDYKKLGYDKGGNLRPVNKSVALRHRLSIGVIVSDSSLKVKYKRGKYLGTIEEWFVSRLERGDTFWFAGKALSFQRIKGNNVIVTNAKSKKMQVPSWMGGRLPLSSQLSSKMRDVLKNYVLGEKISVEIKKLGPLLDLQAERSHLPVSKSGTTNLLIEFLEDREGFHIMLYPFEGRTIHEGIASLLAYRLSLRQKVSFSLAYNDYGLELLSSRKLDLDEETFYTLLSIENLHEDILASVNEVELAKRRFRDIASISGMIFHGYPGRSKREKHLISSSSLLFEVFHDYEDDNLLYQQAFEEVFYFQLDEVRIRETLNRLSEQEINIRKIDKPSPFSFPIIVDRLRAHMSSESVSDMVFQMLESDPDGLINER